METSIKTYLCECGKEYTNPQAFNGHKSSCKVHLEALGKPLSSGLSCIESRVKSSTTRAKHRAEKATQLAQLWRAEQHKCERCGIVMFEKFGTGRFCSRACANSRTHSEDTCKKISSTIQQTNEQLKDLKIKTGKKLSQYRVSKKTLSKIIANMDLPCSCCGAHVPGVPWDLHHIIQRAAGGSDFADNLTYICPNCHRICHTNPELLPKQLISLDIFLDSLDKNWQDYCLIRFKER